MTEDAISAAISVLRRLRKCFLRVILPSYDLQSKLSNRSLTKKINAN